MRRPGLLLSLALIALVLLAAFFPGLFTSQDPLSGVPREKLQRPGLHHIFGTDQLGRDLFSRVVHGSALTLKATALAVSVGLVVGSGTGLLALHRERHPAAGSVLPADRPLPRALRGVRARPGDGVRSGGVGRAVHRRHDAAGDQQIIDKILGYHEVYRHDLQSITVDGVGLGQAQQIEALHRFAEEIAPVVRREAPTALWG